MADVKNSGPKPRRSNEEIVRAAAEYLRQHQAENQAKWDQWQKDYQEFASKKKAAESAPKANQNVAEDVKIASIDDVAASIASKPELDMGKIAALPSGAQTMKTAPTTQYAAATQNAVGASTAPLMYNVPDEVRERLAAESEARRDAELMEAYNKRQEQMAADKETMEVGVTKLNELSEGEKKALGQYVAQRNVAQANMLTGMYDPTATDTYMLNNPLVQKYGIDKVRQMAEIYERQQNEALAQQTQQAAAENVNGKVGNAIGQSALSVGTNLVGNLTSLAGRTMEMQNRTGQFSTLQQHTAGDLPSLYASAVRGEVSQNISGDKYDEEGNQIEEGGALRQGGAYLYQGVMSLADSIARATFGGGAVGGAVLAASGSFSQAIGDASAAGATPTQAVLLGVATAGMEYLTEKIPMDEVFKVAKSGNTNVLKQMFKQAGVEITTEELSLFGTLAAEAAIMQEQSSYKQQIAEAMANGATYAEAKQMADNAIWEQVKETAIVSGISGGISGGSSAVVGNARNGNAQTDVQTPTQAEVATEAATAPAEQAQQTEATTQPQQTETVAEAPQMPKERQAAQDVADMLMGKEKPAQPEVAENGIGQKNTAIFNGSENGLREYTQKEKDNWKSSKRIVLFEGVEQFKKFIRNALTGDGSTGKKIYFGAISDSLAAKIRDATNIAVAGYNLSLGENEIRKINKSHGNEAKEAQRGQRAVTESDFLNIPNIIQNADDITRSDSDYNGKPAIEFRKRNGNEVTTVVAVVSDKRLDVFVQTEYINKKSGSIATPKSVQADSFTPKATGGTAPVTETTSSLVGDAEASRVTSETKAKSDTVFNNSVAENNAGVKGTGAAEQNFSGKAQYQDLLTDDNVQRQRPDDVRDVEVPKKDAYDRDVSEFVGNAVGAKITSDNMVNTIEELVQEGALGFDKRSNQDALNDAAKEIEARGAYSVRSQITNNIANGKIKDGDIEKAMLLYAKFANRDSKQAIDNASELMVDLATMAHMTGRNLQLFKLLRKLTPEGQVMTVRKMVTKNVDSMIRSGKVDGSQRPELNEQLLDEYKKAAAENARAVSAEQKQASEVKMQELQRAIMADAASQLKCTFKAKWDAWRYMAMLGNGRTQIRNIAGNALFVPYKAAKDTIGAAFELALPKEQRTKSIVTDPKLMQWARQDAKTTAVQDALMYTGKLGDNATDAKFSDQIKVFDSKILENTRKIVEALPQKGDMLFKNGHYASSLAGFLNARGYKLSDLEAGNISDAVMAEARGYAINEAMKATFNDCNAFSDAISSIGRKQTDNPWSKAINYAAESVLPFRRTPANILVRFTEYSPVGILKGAWDMADKVSSGKLSAASAVDQLASGLAGSGALMLGYFMAKGIGGIKLTGGGTDEDEKRQGHQNYAIEFSIDGKEYSYTIDWAAPANLPLFVGANLYNAMEGNGADTSISALSRIWQATKVTFEPMLQLSCLSSLNDLVEGIRYAPEGEALYSIAADLATGYLTQGIPALARQAYQASKANKQTTFANDPDPTIRELQKVGTQIPFLADKYQTDKRNAWGETETTENGTIRAINAFLNPGTLKAIDNSAIEQEITRLNEAQTVNVTPPTVDKRISYTDRNGEEHKNQRLTEEQYQSYAQTQGQTAKRILDQLVQAKGYRNMTDAEKANTIKAVYEYAAEKGKQAALGKDYYSTADAWIGKTKEGDLNAFMLQGSKKVLNSVVDNVVTSLAQNWEVSKAAKDDLEASWQTFDKMSKSNQDKLLEAVAGDTARYLLARRDNVSTKSWMAVTDNIADLKPEKGEDKVSAYQKYEAITKTKNVSTSEVDALMRAYMPDYDPDNGKTQQTEIKYDYMRQVMKISPEKAIAALRISGENGKKDEKKKRWIKLGLSQAQADTLWNLLNSNSEKEKIDVVAWSKSRKK